MKKMTEPGAPCLLLEGLSWDCMPSYALPWVGSPGTRAQEWGPSTSDRLLQLLENLTYGIPCCRQLFPLYVQDFICLPNSLKMMWTRRLQILTKVYKYFKTCMS